MCHPERERRICLKITKKVSLARAYDFSFAKKADSALTQQAGNHGHYQGG
jgi:hypothetical protein